MMATDPLRVICLAAACCAVFPSSYAMAQTYPNRPIRLIVPYPPGGGVDLDGRVIAQRLAASLGQPVIVENRPGAGAMIGIEAVVRAPADGYTLLVVDPSVVINPTLHAKAPYSMANLKPVSMLTASPLILSVTASFPAKDARSLFDYVRAHPGEVNYATPGIGTTPHMAGETLVHRHGLPLTQVPYKGSGLAMADLVAGHVQMAFSSIAASSAFIKEGKIRGLATTGKTRPDVVPNLPTMAEAGLANFEVLFWTGLFVPAGTPAAIVDKLNQEVKKALAHPDTLSTFQKAGEVAAYMSVADTDVYVQSESLKWGGLVREANMQP